MKVLQVLLLSGRGGAEEWITRQLQALDETGVKTSFVSHVPRSEIPSALRDRLESRRLYPAPVRWRPLRYFQFFAELMREEEFDAVHTHVDIYGAAALASAKRAGIPLRIAHAHSASLHPRRTNPPAWAAYAAYRTVARRAIRFSATRRLAVSGAAARHLFGSGVTFELFPPSVPLFREVPSEQRIRAARKGLGLDPDGYVFCNVGRRHESSFFLDSKRSRFLLRLFAALSTKRPGAQLLLVGSGRLVHDLRQLSVELGVAAEVIFAEDVRSVLEVCLASDALLMPSRSEGLGLAVVQAQSTGLPCYVSSGVPAEARIVDDLFHRLDTGSDPKTAGARLALLPTLEPEERIRRARAAQEKLAESLFDARRSTQALSELYDTASAHGGGS